MPKPPSRSEIMAADMYVSDNTGRNTLKNIKLVREAHARHLNETSDGPFYEPKDITWNGFHICDSYKNPALSCVYCVADDPGMDQCLYCGAPFERK